MLSPERQRDSIDVKPLVGESSPHAPEARPGRGTCSSRRFGKATRPRAAPLFGALCRHDPISANSAASLRTLRSKSDCSTRPAPVGKEDAAEPRHERRLNSG